jgi:ABC-type dipeptide/oligopeptide/nickel transport system permease subunit
MTLASESAGAGGGRVFRLPALNAGLAFGGTVLAALILVAIFAPRLAPHDPMEQDLLNQYLPPAWWAGGDPAHVLGTDNLGRDLLSRLIYGSRPALLVMALGATLSGLVGVTLGLLAGYFGGMVDQIVSRAIDIFMSFPPMLLTIVLVAIVNPGLQAVIFAIVLVGWTRFCRVIRAEMLVLREQGFVKSAQAIASTHSRILYHEILPNLVPALSVLFALEMGRAIVVEAILSFIGFSSSDMPTWGSIIADGRGAIYQAWWIMAAPIAVIIVAVLGLNALGEGIRRSIDPVLRS